ncbi:MAG: ferredoxin [Planctomycetes bacterium]|nr:ferredoxin [Planctomycetota bacterium]
MSNEDEAVGKFDRHVFVCLNERPGDHPRGCCSNQDAAALHARLKALAREKGLQGKVRVNRAGCLDTCQHGASVVVYPDAVWYGRVTLDDAEEIVERHLVRGEAVERLRLSPDELRG